MKSFLAAVLLLLYSTAIVAFLAPSGAAAFASSSLSETRTSTSLNFFGGAPKDDGSPGDYLCKVIYDHISDLIDTFAPLL